MLKEQLYLMPHSHQPWEPREPAQPFWHGWDHPIQPHQCTETFQCTQAVQVAVCLSGQTGHFTSVTKDRTEMWQHKSHQNYVQQRNCHNPSQIYFGSNPDAGKDYGKAPTGLLGAAYDLHVDAFAQGTASSVQGWCCSVSLQAELLKPKGLQFP